MRSPIIPTRASSILEVMETVGIPHNNLPLGYFGYVLGRVVAVTTDPQILENSNRSSWRSADNSKSNGQSLTMTCEDLLLLVLFNILQHKAVVGNVTKAFHLSSHSPQLFTYLLVFRMGLAPSIKDINLLIDFYRAPPRSLP